MLSDILFYLFLAVAAILNGAHACRTRKHEEVIGCQNTSDIKPPIDVIRDDNGGYDTIFILNIPGNYIITHILDFESGHTGRKSGPRPTQLPGLAGMPLVYKFVSTFNFHTISYFLVSGTNLKRQHRNGQKRGNKKQQKAKILTNRPHLRHRSLPPARISNAR